MVNSKLTTCKVRQQRMQGGKSSTAEKGSREEGNNMSRHVSMGWTHRHIDSINSLLEFIKVEKVERI